MEQERKLAASNGAGRRGHTGLELDMEDELLDMTSQLSALSGDALDIEESRGGRETLLDLEGSLGLDNDDPLDIDTVGGSGMGGEPFTLPPAQSLEDLDGLNTGGVSFSGSNARIRANSWDAWPVRAGSDDLTNGTDEEVALRTQYLDLSRSDEQLLGGYGSGWDDVRLVRQHSEPFAMYAQDSDGHGMVGNGNVPHGWYGEYREPHGSPYSSVTTSTTTTTATAPLESTPGSSSAVSDIEGGLINMFARSLSLPNALRPEEVMEAEEEDELLGLHGGRRRRMNSSSTLLELGIIEGNEMALAWEQVMQEELAMRGQEKRRENGAGTTTGTTLGADRDDKDVEEADVDDEDDAGTGTHRRVNAHIFSTNRGGDILVGDDFVLTEDDGSRASPEQSSKGGGWLLQDNLDLELPAHGKELMHVLHRNNALQHIVTTRTRHHGAGGGPQPFSNDTTNHSRDTGRQPDESIISTRGMDLHVSRTVPEPQQGFKRERADESDDEETLDLLDVDTPHAELDEPQPPGTKRRRVSEQFERVTPVHTEEWGEVRETQLVASAGLLAGLAHPKQRQRKWQAKAIAEEEEVNRGQVDRRRTTNTTTSTAMTSTMTTATPQMQSEGTQAATADAAGEAGRVAGVPFRRKKRKGGSGTRNSKKQKSARERFAYLFERRVLGRGGR